MIINEVKTSVACRVVGRKSYLNCDDACFSQDDCIDS